MEIIRDKNIFFKDEEIVLTEFSVLPVIGKEKRVVEEIRITKKVTTRQERMNTTIKRRQVEAVKID